MGMQSVQPHRTHAQLRVPTLGLTFCYHSIDILSIFEQGVHIFTLRQALKIM